MPESSIRQRLLGTALATKEISANSSIKLFVPSCFDETEFTNDPNNPGEWDRLIDSLSAGDVIVINPDSGPSTGRRPKFKAIMDAAMLKGIIVLGYVHTLVDAEHKNYHTRRPNDIFAEISKYKEYYGINDIFFDEFDTRPETSKDKLFAFYKSICEHVRNGETKSRTTLNPGTVIEERFARITDWIVVFEDIFDQYQIANNESGHWAWSRKPEYRNEIVHLVHTTGTVNWREALQIASNANAWFQYVTVRQGECVWYSLPGTGRMS